LVFTNTRSQAELWFKAVLDARPDWAGVLALHHGSLDRGVREWVEGALKSGQLKAAICTSSLDLGVDFLPVERVLQIGSTKGVARLLQRAGRSGHAPGRPSRITLVPTHSLELVEAAAARAAAEAGQVEARLTPHQPLDVLVQHLVTVALGGGFVPDALYAEVRQTAAFADLSQDAWQWCLDFVRQGGPTLAIYPDYQRVVPDEEGIWRVPDARLARRHRLNIGTISSDASMAVQFWSAGGQAGGARLGSIEENFIARLKPGECFQFAGRVLELVRVHQMTAFVKRATRKTASVPRWSGGRMPLSNTLADAMVQQLAAAAQGRFDSPEMQAAQPLLAIQQRWSALPMPQTLVAEVLKSRDGWHLFVYPFAGRNVHLGLGNLLAWRAAREQPTTFSIAVNDYGLELLSASEVDWATRLPALLAPAASPDALLDEVLASLNASELARRKFRDIARVSGLIFNGTPDERKSSRQLQASSSLFYNVFRQYDPANELLLQADRELLQDELEIGRLTASLARMAGQQLLIQALSQPTPFSFPLMVERLREQLSNETLADRIARMVAQLETTAGSDGAAGQPDDVLKMLAFGQDVQTGSTKGKPRRPRKPSRPLPLL
ncbi:MAG: helicase-related protein, partial [Polaromonas sp.]